MARRPVRLLAIMENCVPFMLAGTEFAMHQTFRELVKSHGFECTIAMTRSFPGGEQTIEGVRIIHYDDVVREPTPDLIVTALYEAVYMARSYASRLGVPLVYFQHTQGDVPGAFALVVFNAQYLCDRYVDRPKLVFHPPVYPEEYKVQRTGEYITRIGMSPQKGAHMFWHLARKFPEKQFLGVTGGWGPQILDPPDGIPCHNVLIVQNTKDVKSIYRKTRILLVPSDEHETWCRTAIEAMASGIVVVGSTIPALRESLSYAGIFCRLDMPEDWANTIRCLDHEVRFKCHSGLSLKRSRELHPGKTFKPLADALRGLTGVR